MAWTDQCKIAFSTNAKALQLTQVGKKNISKILKDLSHESGIPWKTLYHWWNESENLKNQNIEEVVENDKENTVVTPSTPAKRPICYICEKRVVDLNQRTGEPYKLAHCTAVEIRGKGHGCSLEKRSVKALLKKEPKTKVVLGDRA